MTTSIEYPLPSFQWPLSGPVNQRITTSWFSPSYTLNYAGDPAIEHRVVSEVASYGRQIGWISEILLAVVDPKQIPSHSLRTLAQLKAASEHISKIKEDVQRSAVEAANDALDRLQRENPERYNRLLRRRQRELP